MLSKNEQILVLEVCVLCVECIHTIENKVERQSYMERLKGLRENLLGGGLNGHATETAQVPGPPPANISQSH